MVLIGLLIMLGCAAVAADAFVENDGSLNALFFTHGVSGRAGALFVIGCCIGVLFAFGLSMFLGGFSRGFSRRRERRALLRRERDAADLRERNAQLESELAARDAGPYPNEPAATTTTTTADGVTSGRHRVD